MCTFVAIISLFAFSGVDASSWEMRTASCSHVAQGGWNRNRKRHTGTVAQCIADCDLDFACQGLSYNSQEKNCFYFAQHCKVGNTTSVASSCTNSWCNYNKLIARYKTENRCEREDGWKHLAEIECQEYASNAGITLYNPFSGSWSNDCAGCIFSGSSFAFNTNENAGCTSSWKTVCKRMFTDEPTPQPSAESTAQPAVESTAQPTTEQIGSTVVHCEVSQWSGWSKCSKECGGGQQARLRAITVKAAGGGKTCPKISEERLCNVGSCHADCILSEWSGWSPCSKACRWRPTAMPGMQTRSKSIAVAAKGNGKCPKPKTLARYTWQKCNDFTCPTDIQCVANMDAVLVLDGSKNLDNNNNWQLMKRFAEDLMKAAKWARVDNLGRVANGVRFGTILYSSSVNVISPITHKKDEAITKIQGMKWPGGSTMTDMALQKAITMFQARGTRDRMQVIVLVTDGQVSNRSKTSQAAELVRANGIRLIVVPVKNAMPMRAEMCSWASRPCSENMIMTPNWETLISKLRWYMTTLCPVIENQGLEGNDSEL